MKSIAMMSLNTLYFLVWLSLLLWGFIVIGPLLRGGWDGDGE